MADEFLEVVKHFIHEREAMRKKREEGLPPPWTDDPILQTYSFCNVERERDRGTRWIDTNWRGPHAQHPVLPFAMVVARLVNSPDTLAELGFPSTWDVEHFKQTLRGRTARGELVFGPAYVIPNGGKKKPKIDYVADDILTPLWKYREYWRPKGGDKLGTVAARLQQFTGIGSFLTGQVIADLKYVEPLLAAPDWMTFVTRGPGSEQGLARVIGRPADYEWSSAYPAWITTFRQFESAMRPWLEDIGLGDLHCQDLQNCLCETDKYWRTLNGEGKPKRRYLGGGAPKRDAA